MRRLVASLVALALTVGGIGASGAAGAATKKKLLPMPLCPPRILVLSAMPVELSAVMARYLGFRHAVPLTTKTIGGHDYYLGSFDGASIVFAQTGIGPANAKRATDAAFSAFPCKAGPPFREAVFSGVAGGDYIGDVIVPELWTADAGKHVVWSKDWLLSAARASVNDANHMLRTTAPAGDPACGCVTSPDAVTTVAVTHKPVVKVGGVGQTTDPFSGRALPCVPGGGDVFGCAPCAAKTNATRDGEAFGPGVVPFVDPAFFAGYSSSSATGTGYVAEDEETAVVATEMAKRHVAFIGFRGVSDGKGDPLGLPGFPAQFFYYRQLAADNAAIATFAFLETLAIEPHIAVEEG
jgi:nucleoside phosphorylase